MDLVALHKTSNAAEFELPMDVSSGHFHLQQTQLLPIVSDKVQPFGQSLGTLSGKTVNAVAGIGDPTRFFQQLTLAGMTVNKFPKPDHHEWAVTDLTFENDCPVVVTSKDAVKVRALLQKVELTVPVFEVCVAAVLDAELSQALSVIEDRLHTQYRHPSKSVR